MTVRPRSFRRFGDRAQDLRQFRLGFVELADVFLAIDLDGKRHGGTQQQTFSGCLRDQLVIGPQTHLPAEFGRQRDHATAGDGESGFHVTV